MWRWARGLTLAVLAGTACLSTPAPAADVRPPDQVPSPAVPQAPGSPPIDRELKREVPPPRPSWRSRDRIVYAFDRPAADLLAPSPELSAACRRGRFIQRVNLLYRAFGPQEQPLGVAYGRAAINLVDPGRLRREDTVYFFEEQDTGRCTVHTALLEDIRPYFVGP
ncbi:hypothetical protein [Indioceanicola profundi]|uniref:hypothetical protein n=1 Tax=Indioceanicola profundi TaxID=2220096 RepID=UPI000E6AD818|nr:hypothetical protein [Indioceanicola profundi]